MSDLSNLGLKISALYRCGIFEDGHTHLSTYIDILIESLKNNKINEIIHLTHDADFTNYLTNINEAFNRSDFIRIADIIEFEIQYKQSTSN